MRTQWLTTENLGLFCKLFQNRNVKYMPIFEKKIVHIDTVRPCVTTYNLQC